ncbi:MAG: sporulation peptidase YabG, partial [Thermoanaerobacterium sp.]|nr:sporulation peptidase YabG [Thermoanaerobacterium sp.]
MPFKVNDIVVRKSHGFDLLFKVIDVIENRGTRHYLLHGLNMRIVADAPEDDLLPASLTRINEYDEPYQRKANYLIKKIAQSKDLRKSNVMRSNRSEPYGKPGTVLHIDGDEGYLNICLDAYKKANIVAYGEIVDEKEQPDKVVALLSKYKPDILVLTGHDGVKNTRNYSDLNNYRNSKYFVEAVKKARSYEP